MVEQEARAAGFGFGGSGGEMAIGPEGGDDVLLDGDISEVALDDVGAAPADAQTRRTARDQAAGPLQAPHSQVDVSRKAAEAADVEFDSGFASILFGAADWCGAGSDGSDGSRLRAGVSDSGGSDGDDHGTREDRAAGRQRQQQQEQKRTAAGCSDAVAAAVEQDTAATEHAEVTAAAAMCRRPMHG